MPPHYKISSYAPLSFNSYIAQDQTRREQKGIEMNENVYGPVKQSTIPSSGGSTAVPEYEEVPDIQQEGVEMSENVSYGPVKQSTIPSSGLGITAVPEYEEVPSERVEGGSLLP